MTENLDAICRLEVEGSDASFAVLRVEGQEAICEPERYVVVAEPSSQLDMFAFGDEVISQPARLTFDPEGESPRIIHLVVDQIDSLHDGLRFELISRIGTLLDSRDHRVFLELDALQIAEELLTEHDFVLDVRCQRSLEKRPQCVQNFESDLAFVTRILGEEGISWHSSREERDTLVLVDSVSGHDDLPGGALTVQVTGNLRDAVEGRSATAVSIRHRTATDKYTLRDYNFTQPSLDMTAAATQGDGEVERYEYRAQYLDPAIGTTLADLWLEGCRAERTVLHATTALQGLSPGQVIELTGGGEESAEGRWLLVRVKTSADAETDAHGGIPYRAELEAVPADAPFRLERPQAAPMPGMQTMTVTGASGSEIETEEHGRVHAHFRWDRLRPLDDTASTWLRVAQPPNSGGFLLPRVQWETLMGFWASADDPFVVGRLYNAEATPPNGLPADKVVSAYGTLTTPGGGSANRFEFNDTAGNEAMNFNASYDFNERTENDKATSITADESITVGANQTSIIGQVHSVAVTGSQSYSVGATREVRVEANKGISCSTETVAVGGARIFDIGGDQATYSSVLTRVVGGAKVIASIEHESVLTTGGMARTYGGSWSQTVGMGVGVDVGGVNDSVVGGTKSVKSKAFDIKAGKLSEKYASRKEKADADIATSAKGAVTYDLKGACKMKGAEIVFEADSSIDIKAGGVKIKITKSKVSIKGVYKVKGGSNDTTNEKYD